MKQFAPDKKRFGVWKAIKLFAKRRHVLQVAAYLLLALALAWTIQTEHEHANQQRAAVAAATRQQFIESCQRGNKLRLVLVGLLQQERPQIAQAVKRGQIDTTQAKAYLAQLNKNIATVGPQPCTVTKGLQSKHAIEK